MDWSCRLASGHRTDTARIDTLGFTLGTVHSVRSLGILASGRLLRTFVQEPA